MNNLEKCVRYGEILEDAVNGRTAHRQSVQVTILTVSATLLAMVVALYNGDMDSFHTTIALRTALVAALMAILSGLLCLFELSAIHKRFVRKIQSDRDKLLSLIKENPEIANCPVSIAETVSQPQEYLFEVAEYISYAAAMIEIFALFVVAYCKFF